MGGATIARSESSAAFPALQPNAEEVRNQLARVLANPLFRNSRHYPALLRYVVEETLEGRQGRLKERSLGVGVFGREPNYDTNLDPVVRTSACEVRKRLAQYYHEHETDATVQIDLPHGSYVPEFRYREIAVAAQAPSPQLEPLPAPAAPSEPPRPWFRRYAAVTTVAAILVASGLAAAWSLNRSMIDRFWSPVSGASDSIMICLGGFSPPAAEPAPTVFDLMRQDHVAFSDALTLGRLTGIFRENHKRFDIRRASDFTLNDFRHGPVVLIGAFDNPWTLRLENQLRFVLEKNPAEPGTNVIRDRRNPSRTNWTEDDSIPYTRLTADYAIVSRFLDPRTEKVVVVVAGLTKYGTIAAGEFATEERYLQSLASQAPSGWERKNLQVVIATEIINGIAGPPRVLASYFW